MLFRFNVKSEESLIKHLRGMFLKAEKKDNMVKMRAYKKVINQNKRINKINLVILAAGLLLMVLGVEKVGNYLLWVGMFVFFITALSGIFASGSFRKQR